jgi:hypothetical protein
LRRTFYASLLAGVVVTILAAGVFPLPQHQRYRSITSVLTNGGRQESFTIEWPRDRVPLTGQSSDGLLVNAGGAVILPGPEGVAASAEVFRLRDASGNVVGLASRATTTETSADGKPAQGTNWMLLLPSRGSLLLRQLNVVDTTPRPRTPGGGLVPAQDAPGFWARGTRQRITGQPEVGGAGQVIGGTEEFDRLQGSYEEIWELTEVAADGATRGRIMLSTQTTMAP